MHDPLISIIIPIYNSEKYLRKCIDSVISQTFNDWEMILIDDGSTDNSGSICNEYASDSRVIIKHAQNGGVSKARNMGLRLAKGDYVTFMDSDDWLEPNAFEIYNRAIVSTPPQPITPDIIKVGYYQDYGNGQSEQVTIPKPKYLYDTTEMLVATDESRYFGFLWDELIKRSVIGSICFDEDISWCEDHLFSLQVFSACKSMALLPDVLYHYCIHSEESLSNVRDPQMILDVANKVYDLKHASFRLTNKAAKMADNSYFNSVGVSINVLYKQKRYPDRKRFHCLNIDNLRKVGPNKRIKIFFSKNEPYIWIDIRVQFERICSRIKRSFFKDHNRGKPINHR